MHISIKYGIVKFITLYYTNLEVYYKMFDQNKVFSTYLQSCSSIHRSFLTEEHNLSEVIPLCYS
jgi:hypothetical protein